MSTNPYSHAPPSSGKPFQKKGNTNIRPYSVVYLHTAYLACTETLRYRIFKINKGGYTTARLLIKIAYNAIKPIKTVHDTLIDNFFYIMCYLVKNKF